MKKGITRITNLKRKRKHGFRRKMRTAKGRLVIKRRRHKKRKRLTI
ncbi:MAG: 50S ribosomal protein L34 [Candidatus Omnitrophica bacterium]|nr:50S ribosomal protein L34 [Candidatus Omnitrophota bacterium]MBU1933266.1 50S ribosomal protein L34 [Candidatus Omnitrophota bacterium]